MQLFFTEPAGSGKKPTRFLPGPATMRIIMRASLFNTFLALTSLQLLQAHNINGQDLEKTKVTIEMKNESLSAFFTKLSEATKISIAYSDYDIKDLTVSFPAAERTVIETINLALKGKPLAYKQIGEASLYIYATKKNDRKENKTENELQQSGTGDSTKDDLLMQVIGKVSDVNGVAMAGVNIMVKGTTNGSTTDADGKYTIEAGENDFLIFSFIGYRKFEIQVGGRSVIDVMLEEDISALQEVVINAGYWQVSKKEGTGSISKITSKEIEKQPVANPLSALQGRMPGLYIQQQSGIVGGNFTVRIRGQNSLRSDGNDPLYIIDGVPFSSTPMSSTQTSSGLYSGYGSSPLSGINVNDIESIEVLKDADATAIYGSRGANGVVLITTKKGKVGKTKVDVGVYHGVSQVARKADLLSTPQYLEMRNEAFANDGVTPGVSDYDVNGTWDQNRQTDWQKELIGNTANTTDAQLSLSGGEGNTQFLVSTNYHRETVPLPGKNTDKRISSHINLSNTALNQKLRTSFTASYTSNFSNFISNDLTLLSLTLAPNAPALYDDNGELNWENSTWDNPLRYMETKYEAITNTLMANANVSYEIFPNFELITNIGYTNIRLNAVKLTPKSFYKPSEQSTKEHVSSFSNTNFRNWVIEPQLHWKPEIGIGDLDILVGTSFLDQTDDRNDQTASGFTSESLMKNIQAASMVSYSNSYSQYRYAALFGRINYILKGKYIVNLTARRDGSSRFGPGKQFTNFGAAGIAWVFSEENFVRSLPFVSFGKLRASYGLTGNDQIGDYQYLDTYTPSQVYYNITGLKPVRLSNADFAWETNKKLEVGLELGFLNNKINLESSYFYNRSSNQLVGTPLPPTAGFTSIQSNFPATVQNTGLEIGLSTSNIMTNDFSWTTSFNITIPRNKLVEFRNLEGSSYASTLEIGEPLTISKRYHSLGVDPISGLYKVEDVNDDGYYDFNDQVFPKFIGQRYYGGFQNTFNYKSFELILLFQFVKQSNWDYQYIGYTTPGRLGNQTTEVLNRWRENGQSSSTQLFSTTSNAANQYSLYMSSDATVVDASFIRLKNLSLSYSFQNNWIQKLHLQQAKLFVQSQNLMTFTRYKGLDPEQGINLPPMKALTAGIRLTF